MNKIKLIITTTTMTVIALYRIIWTLTQLNRKTNWKFSKVLTQIFKIFKRMEFSKIKTKIKIPTENSTRVTKIKFRNIILRRTKNKKTKEKENYKFSIIISFPTTYYLKTYPINKPKTLMYKITIKRILSNLFRK